MCLPDLERPQIPPQADMAPASPRLSLQLPTGLLSSRYPNPEGNWALLSSPRPADPCHPQPIPWPPPEQLGSRCDQ